MKRISEIWSKKITKDPVANVRLRLKLLERCETDMELRAGVMQACRDDPLFWICMFVIQSNPKHLKHKVGPFITRGYQDKSIKRIIRDLFIEGVDHLIEKSREEGASWIAVIIFLWACLFHYDTHVNAVSHTEKAVDNGPTDHKSLFWKCRYILDRLPDWMTQGVVRTKLAFEFPETESSFVGEACTGRSTVGGRGPCLLDEFGKMAKAAEIWDNTADVGPRLIISTHYATVEGQKFAELASRRNISKSLWHWSMNEEKSVGKYMVQEKDGDPIKLDPAFDYTDYPFVTTGKPGGPFHGIRSKWYDDECERRGNARGIAMHLDIDRSGASSLFFDDEKIRELKLQYATEPLWEGEILYDKQTGRFISLTKRTNGPLKLWRRPNMYGRMNPGRFTIGADVSGGSSLTDSCLAIIDKTLCEKVGEYAIGTIFPYDFAPLAAAMGWLFKTESDEPARICWETNGPGGHFGKKLVELKYPNCHHLMEIPPNVPSPRRKETPGWTSTTDTKTRLLDDYKEAIETRRLIVRSRRSLDECLLFRLNKAGKLEHTGQVEATDGADAGENHADMTIGDALAWLVCLDTGSGVRAVELAKEVPVGSMLWRREYAQRLELSANNSWDDR